MHGNTVVTDHESASPNRSHATIRFFSNISRPAGIQRPVRPVLIGNTGRSHASVQSSTVVFNRSA